MTEKFIVRIQTPSIIELAKEVGTITVECKDGKGHTMAKAYINEALISGKKYPFLHNIVLDIPNNIEAGEVLLEEFLTFAQ